MVLECWSVRSGKGRPRVGSSEWGQRDTGPGRQSAMALLRMADKGMICRELVLLAGLILGQGAECVKGIHIRSRGRGGPRQRGGDRDDRLSGPPTTGGSIAWPCRSGIPIPPDRGFRVQRSKPRRTGGTALPQSGPSSLCPVFGSGELDRTPRKQGPYQGVRLRILAVHKQRLRWMVSACPGLQTRANQELLAGSVSYSSLPLPWISQTASTRPFRIPWKVLWRQTVRSLYPGMNSIFSPTRSEFPSPSRAR